MAGGCLREPVAGVIAAPFPGGRGAAAPDRAQAVPLALYVHIPWCVRKCPYCDFNSHAAPEDLDQGAYVDALLRDLEHETARQPLPTVGSIFLGGGTPSLFGGAPIARLIDGIAQRLELAPDVEVTLEANPGTAEAARFAAYRDAGINRLSIGVQSLHDPSLLALGRIHTAAQARTAYRLARTAGFENINLDLMYGLPGQSLAGALADLEELIALGPAHLSWYQLTLEPNTLFHHRPPVLPDDDSLADIMDAGQAMLAEAGYRQYEISAYAAGARQCRHNLNYWQFGDYLGIGAGAHGKLTGPDGVVRRRSKRRHPAAYLEGIGDGAVAGERVVGAAELPLEFFLNALRLRDGVAVELFGRRTGLPIEGIAAVLTEARARGLMQPGPARLAPTALGLRYLNDLLALFEPVEGD